MKDFTHKMVSIILLIALYFNVLGGTDASLLESFPFSNTKEKTVYHTNPFAILISAANFPLESVVKVIKENSATFCGFGFCRFSGVLRVSEQLFSSAFGQYSSCLQNFPILFQKFDIPFPFHVFW